MWIVMKQEMMEWQWHQLDHMQIICTSLQADNHASTSSLNFYRPDALLDAQQCQSTESNISHIVNVLTSSITFLLPLPRRICTRHCLSVSNFVQKLPNRFA